MRRGKWDPTSPDVASAVADRIREMPRGELEARLARRPDGVEETWRLAEASATMFPDIATDAAGRAVGVKDGCRPATALVAATPTSPKGQGSSRLQPRGQLTGERISEVLDRINGIVDEVADAVRTGSLQEFWGEHDIAADLWRRLKPLEADYPVEVHLELGVRGMADELTRPDVAVLPRAEGPIARWAKREGSAAIWAAEIKSSRRGKTRNSIKTQFRALTTRIGSGLCAGLVLWREEHPWPPYEGAESWPPAEGTAAWKRAERTVRRRAEGIDELWCRRPGSEGGIPLASVRLIYLPIHFAEHERLYPGGRHGTAGQSV